MSPQRINLPRSDRPKDPGSHFTAGGRTIRLLPSTRERLPQYNLDPLVWLVHTAANWPDHERIFADAFLVDDNDGNVLIPGSSGMEVTIGGATGLTDPTPDVNPASRSLLAKPAGRA